MARWLVKALALSPAVVTSTFLTTLVGAAMPPLAGSVLFFGGLLAGLLLLVGACCCGPGRPEMRSWRCWPAR